MTTEKRFDIARLILRVAIGAVFFAHGWMKIGMGHAGVTGFFANVGIPLPGLAAWGIMALETAGAAAIVLGLLTRPIAALLVCNMLGAISMVVFKKGFVGGYELEFLLAMGAASLALSGAGAFSLDVRIPALRKIA